MANGVKKRIIYLDYLRALAIITVILFHIGKRFDFIVLMDYATLPSFNWFLNDFLLTCCRCGVDIFLMLSGALSLGRVWDIKSFLGKRIPRIVLPFVFWGFVLCLVIVLLSMIFPEQIFYFGQYTFDGVNSFIMFLGEAYMDKSKWFGPYWFFWMILGTYLIMPIFNKWILHSSMKEVEYFLVIWFVTCITGTSILNIDFPIKLTYFTGPIGMVVLGYYLRHTERPIFNKLWFSVLLMLIGGASAIIASYLNSSPVETCILGRYSVFLAVEVIGIFLFFKNVDNLDLSVFKGENSILRKISFSIAKYSYGIYLTHQVVLNLVMVFLIPFVHYKALVVLVFLGTLIISWGILAVLNRVPYVNRVIGSK